MWNFELCFRLYLFLLIQFWRQNLQHLTAIDHHHPCQDLLGSTESWIMEPITFGMFSHCKSLLNHINSLYISYGIIIVIHNIFYSYKFIKQYDTQPSNKHFIIEFHPLIQPYTFLGSLAAIVKVYVKAWLLTSSEKEILETHISL
jgi:hypothetical protein